MFDCSGFIRRWRHQQNCVVSIKAAMVLDCWDADVLQHVIMLCFHEAFIR
jgi:hypothetical protein